MIARTALDAGALLDLDEVWKKLAGAGLDATTLEAMNPHRTLARLFQDYSVIQLRGPSDGVALFGGIDVLDEESKALWEATLLALDECNRLTMGEDVRTTGDVFRDQSLPEELGTELDLAVVSQPAYTRRANPPELSIATAVGNSETVRRIRELERNQHYDEGAHRSQIWDERFAPLVRVATEVSVLDHYLFTGFPKGVGAIRHVKWLLNRLNETLQESVPVTIYAKDALPSAELKRNLAAWLEGSQFNKRRPGMLRVCLSPWTEVELARLGDDGQPRRGGKPHNRHIRFNTWAALATEEGFDRFKDPQVSGEDGVSLYRIVTHPKSPPNKATHIRTLQAKEEAIIETSRWTWPR